MIIILKNNPEKEQLDSLLSWLASQKITVHPTIGEHKTILGLVGAGGIGAALIFAISAQKWHAVGAYLLGIVIMTLIVEWVSTNIRRRLSTGE